MARAMVYLADDLRLARWSILPVLGALAFLRAPRGAASVPVPQGWTVSSGAGVAAFHSGDLHVYVPYAGGPIARVFVGDDLLLSDSGMDARLDGGALTAMTYDAERKVELSSTGLSASFDLAPAAYFYPGFLQRLVLRVGSTTSWSSRRLREAIDWYRQRKRTAINQSATSVGRSGSGVTLQRRVEVGEGSVTIVDRVDATGLVVTPRLEAKRLQANSLQNVRVEGSLVLRKLVHRDGRVEVASE
jgi:hypothetical protein